MEVMEMDEFTKSMDTLENYHTSHTLIKCNFLATVSNGNDLPSLKLDPDSAQKLKASLSNVQGAANASIQNTLKDYHSSINDFNSNQQNKITDSTQKLQSHDISQDSFDSEMNSSQDQAIADSTARIKSYYTKLKKIGTDNPESRQSIVTIAGIGSSIFNTIVSTLQNFCVNLVDNIVSFFENALSKVENFFSGAGSEIGDFFASVF